MEVSDQSGHYAPPLDYTQQFLKELEISGIAPTSYRKTLMGKSKLQSKLSTYVGIEKKQERLYPEGPKLKRY